MTLAALAGLAVGSGRAAAAPGAAPLPATDPAATIIGGGDVPRGMWRDVAAVLFDGQQGCTGVLIAPTVVMTAHHCLDPSIDAVLLGTNSLAHPSRGETIAVVAQVPSPDPAAYDIALLELARPATVPVRKLATGWIQTAIEDGAPVSVVGYGAIDARGTRFVDELRQAATTITDAGCTEHLGCAAAARPDGELGAGGAGVDACAGDSGGPLYLMSPHGAFLVGITSRGYASNQLHCSEGGIYTRPDSSRMVAWIEQSTRIALEDGLHPAAEAMTLVWGTTDQQRLAANDPFATDHQWEVVMPPTIGTATIDPGGGLTVTAGDGDGDDLVVVRAVDRADPSRSAQVRIELRYRETLDVGGCCSTGTPAASLGLPLVIAIAGLVRRRQR